MPNLVKIGKELLPKMSGNQVGRRTLDGGKSKNNMSTPQWGGHNYVHWIISLDTYTPWDQ